MKTVKGFTLIEVLIVVVIIAVMAALIVPRMSAQRERGIVAEATQTLSAIRQSQEAYYLENGSYANNINLLALDIPVAAEWAFTTASSGTSTATRASGKPNENTNITLSAAGVWGGTHPMKPE